MHKGITTTQKVFADTSRYGPAHISEVYKKALDISSKADQYGSANDFLAVLRNPIQPDELYLSRLVFPNNIYNMADAMILDEQGFPPVTFSLPPGVYTVNNIELALETALNLASPSGSIYNVTVDDITYKITVATTVPWRFGGVSIYNRSYQALGYNLNNLPVTQVYGLSQVSTGGYNFATPMGQIKVCIEELPPISSGTSGVPFTFLCGTNSISSDIITTSCNFPYKCSGNISYDRFRIRLYDEDNNPLDVKGVTIMEITWVQRL